MRALGSAVVVLIAGASCVDQGPGPQPKHIDATYISEHLVATVPASMDAHVDADLDGKIVYLGNRVDRPQLVPGGTVHVTHYWQVKVAPGPGWRVFALMRGGADTADFMNLDATDMEIGHGPATWKAGEIIEDIQDITLRPDWRSPQATLLVGLIHVGAHGYDDRMVVKTANVDGGDLPPDGSAAAGRRGVVDRAIVARTFDVDLSRAPAPPGTVYIQRAKGPITIDGMANDPGWQGVPSSPEFATAEGAADPVGKATAKLTWDDTYLYLFVNVTDSDIYSPYKNHDESLWKADDVEIFIDADSNRRGYVELQVNPNNATFDSWFATVRTGGPNAGGDPSWDSGMVTAVKVRGTADKEGDSDQGWDAEVAIPWDAVKGRDANMKVRLPPQVGDRWRLNVVRIDKKTGEKEPSASSWNRISSADYHALDRMLTAVFADQTGAIVAKPVAAAGAGSGSGSGNGSGSGSGNGSGNGSGSGSGNGSGSASAGDGSGSAVMSPAITPRRFMRRAGAGSATTP